MRIDRLDRLAREHTLLLEAVAATSGPFAVYDDQDRLIAWNEAYRRVHAEAFARHADAAARREMRYADLIRASVEAALPPEDVETHIAERVAAHRRGDSAPTDRHYEGFGWFRVAKTLTPSGAVAGFAMPIDELVAKTEALEAARAAAETLAAQKDRFVALVSHELRTPLGGLLGVAALLETTALDDRQRALVAVLRRSGADLLAVVNDLLDDAQLAHGSFALNEGPFSLSGLASDIAALFAPRAAEKGLSLQVELAPEGPDTLIGDATRLRQVLGNLVSNAIKFTETGTVRLRAAAVADGERATLSLTVSDDGPGMSSEDAARLFDPFVQLEAGRAHGGGAGLGLSIARRLVEAMGGTLSVNAAPGAGAAFTATMRLPIG